MRRLAHCTKRLIGVQRSARALLRERRDSATTFVRITLTHCVASPRSLSQTSCLAYRAKRYAFIAAVHSLRVSPKCKKPTFVGFIAGETRLELATSCVTGRRSNQLNYSPVGCIDDISHSQHKDANRGTLLTRLK